MIIDNNYNIYRPDAVNCGGRPSPCDGGRGRKPRYNETTKRLAGVYDVVHMVEVVKNVSVRLRKFM